MFEKFTGLFHLPKKKSTEREELKKAFDSYEECMQRQDDDLDDMLTALAKTGENLIVFIEEKNQQKNSIGTELQIDVEAVIKAEEECGHLLLNYPIHPTKTDSVKEIERIKKERVAHHMKVKKAIEQFVEKVNTLIFDSQVSDRISCKQI